MEGKVGIVCIRLPNVRLPSKNLNDLGGIKIIRGAYGTRFIWCGSSINKAE